MIGIKLRRIKKKYPFIKPLVEPVLDIYDNLFRRYTGWQLKNISDEQYVKQEFKQKFGYPFPIDNPQTFNEKLHWRKLFEKNPFFKLASDKYEVRKYVSETIGDVYLIPLIQVLEHPSELSYKDLPQSFVIKGTHDSQSAVLIHDKNNWNESRLKKVAKRILARKSYYQHQREWQYKEIPPRCIIESMLKTKDGTIPNDYKIHVFNGKVEMIQVANPKHTTNGMYDANWQKLPFDYRNRQPEKDIPQPENLSGMIDVAERLAGSLNYVRVDLYNLDGVVFFGELTFTPNNGQAHFNPVKYDYYYGSLFQLDKRWM